MRERLRSLAEQSETAEGKEEGEISEATSSTFERRGAYPVIYEGLRVDTILLEQVTELLLHRLLIVPSGNGRAGFSRSTREADERNDNAPELRHQD
jgi:hypothetical protein